MAEKVTPIPSEVATRAEKLLRVDAESLLRAKTPNGTYFAEPVREVVRDLLAALQEAQGKLALHERVVGSITKNERVLMGKRLIADPEIPDSFIQKFLGLDEEGTP